MGDETTETGSYLAVAPTSYIGLAVCLISSGAWEVVLRGGIMFDVIFTRWYSYLLVFLNVCANGVAVAHILLNTSVVKPTRCASVSNLVYFGIALYMFRAVFQSIIRSSRLFIQQPNRYAVWHMPVAVCTVLNSWWWIERPPETCRVSFQNKINLIHWCI